MMAYRVERFEDTPNPNAIKCVVSPSPTDKPRSYFNASAAEGDPLATALFGIDGVTNVLIHTGFVTVSKTPSARWSTIRPRIERVLGSADA